MSQTIIQHNGMGDYIICNVLIRSIINNNDSYVLVATNKYKESISFMYRDLKNLTFDFISWGDMRNFPIPDGKFDIKIGFDYVLKTKDTNYQFDYMFYEQFNIPFEYRWSKFIIQRDEKKEKELFCKFEVKEHEYVFIHDTYEFPLNLKYIKNNHLKQIRPREGLTDNIFDYCYLIENAKEIHCIDSSFKNLADSLNINNINLNYHLNRHTFKNKKYYSSCRHNWKYIHYR